MTHRKYKSLAVRITANLVFLLLIILAVGGSLLVYEARNTVSKDAMDKAQRSINDAILKIDSRMYNVETAVETAASFSNVFDKDTTKTYGLLKRIIDSNGDISAATLLYRENFFPEQGRYFAPTVYRNKDGEIESDEIGGPENNFPYLETDSNWIYTNKLDERYWCLPYVDSMSTTRPMVTFSVPLHDENTGETYAVLCADVDLSWVWSMIDEVKPHPKSQFSVLARDGYFICHPDPSVVLSVSVHDIIKSNKKDSDASTLARHMLQGDNGYDTMTVFTSTQSGNGEAKEDDMQSEKAIVFYAPIKRVLWSVSFTLPIDSIMHRPNMLTYNIIMIILLICVIVAVVIYRVIRRQTKPLKKLTAAAGAVAKGDFTAPLPKLRNNDEIAILRHSFADMQQSLVHYIEDLQNTTKQKASIESELNVAANIQMGMVPKTFPAFPDRHEFDVHAMLKPAKEVGGDLYDYLVRDDKFFFCIGDVSGKGVPASLFMAIIRSLFHNIASHTDDPAEIATQINDSISQGNEQNMFCTMFICQLDLKTGVLNYCNAGHNQPVIIRNGGKDIEFMEVIPNLATGLFEGFPYQMETTTMAIGDFIYLYTDGVCEAENTAAELLGDDATIEAVRRSVAKSTEQTTPQSIVEDLLATVKHHAEGAAQSDDITMVCVQYKAQA